MDERLTCGTTNVTEKVVDFILETVQVDVCGLGFVDFATKGNFAVAHNAYALVTV